MDEKWMELALSLAKTASSLREIPVGALIVKDNQIIATGYNRRESDRDPTQHAEIVAIQRASKLLSSWRLNQCTLYVTLEPCLMCAGAIYQSRIAKVCYGTKDPKGGALGSLYNVNTDPRLNHGFDVISGVLEKPCQEILKTFFKTLRQ